MTDTITGTIATTDDSPSALVRRYQQDFTTVLPSHVRGDSWVRLAQGALKTGKKTNGRQFDLEVAATNNPGAFLQALRSAAALGLTPGTEEFYLTPRRAKGGRAEIQGIVGYQGYVELMYRAGAVASVIVEVVRDKDGFDYRPGRDEQPQHTIDWDAEDRGNLRLVYAYARMKDGATSKVVVLNKAHIAAIRAKSDGANSEYSPWNTNEEAMWMKSAARQLRKWVPTSAEYITTQVRAVREGMQAAPTVDVSHLPQADIPDDIIDGEVLSEDDIIDAARAAE